MSRAEEKATEYANSVLLSVNHRGDVRDAFWDGYERAEKDLALAWEDMVTINQLGSEVIGEHLFDNWSERQIYEEVLRRFNEYKQKSK